MFMFVPPCFPILYWKLVADGAETLVNLSSMEESKRGDEENRCCSRDYSLASSISKACNTCGDDQA